MTEEEILKILHRHNEEFRKLGEEHRTLEDELSKFDSRLYLSPDEELERKKIQKLKLYKKDRMAEIIRDYKQGSLSN